MATRSSRAYTSPWPSSESLNTAGPLSLNKRHSVYHFSDLPPPRQPTRTSADHLPRRPRSRRPSTASAAVSSWEDPSRKASSDTQSVMSRTSSLGLLMRTGPVEEVAPWELYPVPASPITNDFKASVSSYNLKNRKSSSSTPTAHFSPSSASRTVSTGPVEEVTPWELSPGPSLSEIKPASPVFLKQSFAPPVAPPRRSLPNLVHESVPVYPRSKATGPTEEVTPWELTPAPAEGQEFEISADVATMPSLSKTMAQLEEVTPWELYPAPRSSGSNLSATSRPSNKSLSEAGNRPRKGNASKSAKTTRSSAATGISNIPHEATAFIGQQKGLSNGFSTANLGAPTALFSDDPRQLEGQDAKFSTADRTTLEQLKLNIRAREDRFVVKGIGNLVMGGGQCRGKKYHPYPAKEAAYPRSYDKEVMDLDVWETMLYFDMCKSLTWHIFETPPTKVLELGCGTGTWIFHCAREWKECHFVGVDIVPIQPDLRNIAPDLSSRITWVQHNFLDGLPFQNEEFDFVHIKRIALGVPENKWDKFFEEVARVMKPGGAFEMIEEDLFFPGKNVNEDSLTDDFFSSITSHWNSTSSEQFSPTTDETLEPGSPQTPTTNTTLLPQTPSRSISPAPRSARKENEEVTLNEEQSLISFDSYPSPSLPTISVPVAIAPTSPSRITFPTISSESSPRAPLRRSSSRPLLSVQNEQSELGLTGTNPAGFGSSLSSAIGTVNKALSRIRSSSTDAKPGTSSSNSLATWSDSEPRSTTRPSPLLLKKLSETPNPRSHTLLETIWNGMLTSRWINSAPLKVLKNYMEWHFKDIRTHPPFMYTFPPTPPPNPDDDSEDTNSDTANILPKRLPPTPHTSDKEHSWLSLQSIQQQQYSPYVPLDGTRGDTLPSSQQGDLAAKRMLRLPTTTTLNADLRTLNHHLALRVKEIIACSEPMWEWVEQFQRETATIPNLNTLSNWSMDMARCAILEMTRDDFDILLNNFTLDLQDQAAVGHNLQERFDWHVMPSWPLPDRVSFESACDKYQEKYQEMLDNSSLQFEHKSNGVVSDVRNSSSTPNINSTISPILHSASAITRSHSSPEATFQNSSDEGTTPFDPAIRPSTQSSPSVQYLTPELPPAQKLSRSMGVFLAWKASQPDLLSLED